MKIKITNSPRDRWMKSVCRKIFDESNVIDGNINTDASPCVALESTNHHDPIPMDEQVSLHASAAASDAISFEQALDHVSEGMSEETEN